MQQGHLKIWQVSDGKPGHAKQATALIEALAGLRKIQHAVLPPWPLTKVLTTLLRPRGSGSQQQSGLVIGVGHGTHPTVLALQRQLGARSAIIMNPSLPARLFDVVITPFHDGFQPGGNRLVTPLSLAPVPKFSNPDYRRGLILLGGKSRHFEWDNEDVLQQMSTLAERYPAVQWQATTSRRTPAALVAAADVLPASIKLLDWTALPSDWLQHSLPEAGHIWITEDSASMLAEAMNTQACVGLIKLTDTQKKNKLRRGTGALEAKGQLATLERPYAMSEDVEAVPADRACGQRENPNIVCAQSLLAMLDL
ncbi:ELM1/GtrOC1 family putative glycosyltransferase [Allohahella marinimesophila]|uniref:ELM1/GtrOC1 family putative glycosyltransferase n=1 Tax=Allohahella marinimesophila TaxID=1054972 RepID=A0ABP7PQK0_9GAMM